MRDKVTFVQDTAQRFINAGIKPNRIKIIVTNDKQYEYAKDQLVKMGIADTNILKISPHYGYVCCMDVATYDVYKYDKEAIVICSPSDQYIAGQEEFTEAINLVCDEVRKGEQVMIGVNITDSNIIAGCGNAYYDNTQPGPVYDVKGFIEKPGDTKRGEGRGPELVKKLLNDSNTVVNTGIIAWRAEDLLKALPIEEVEHRHDELLTNHPNASLSDTIAIDTDELVERLNGIKLVIGKFDWRDCGTLAAYYSIQKQSANHHNACIGPCEKHDMGNRYSLFVSDNDDLIVFANDVKHCAAIANLVGENVYISVTALGHSQDAGKITDYFEEIALWVGDKKPTTVMQWEARNNSVHATNLKGNVYAAFLGVQNLDVTVLKREGKILVIIDCEGECIYNSEAPDK